MVIITNYKNKWIILKFKLKKYKEKWRKKEIVYFMN